MTKALLVWGGWEGHEPRETSEKVAAALEAEGDFQIDFADSLEDAYGDGDALKERDLIIQNWTMGSLESDLTSNLLQAVVSGVAFAGWHGGVCDAFRDNPGYQFMTGGNWVAHPDNIRDYQVRVTAPEDPITRGIADFSMHSEQYYLHVDPANEVLATTTLEGVQSAPWLNGVEMPVMWKRRHGEGRVFYSALGHVAADFEVPEALETLKRGILWACGRLG